MVLWSVKVLLPFSNILTTRITVARSPHPLCEPIQNISRSLIFEFCGKQGYRKIISGLSARKIEVKTSRQRPDIQRYKRFLTLKNLNSLNFEQLEQHC